MAAADPLAHSAGLACLGIAVLIAMFGAWAAVKQPLNRAAGWLGAALVLVGMLGITIYRDALRDLTLLSKGYDVWHRLVATNWGVVSLFLLIFVAGLGVVGWLISVMMKAKTVSENVKP